MNDVYENRCDVEITTSFHPFKPPLSLFSVNFILEFLLLSHYLYLNYIELKVFMALSQL